MSATTQDVCNKGLKLFKLLELPPVLPGEGGGSLKFELVGDVPPAARDPYPCSGVIFQKNVPMFRDFSEKKVPIFSKIFRGSRKFLKIRLIVSDFFMKMGSKTWGTSPYVLTCEYPPPPSTKPVSLWLSHHNGEFAN